MRCGKELLEVLQQHSNLSKIRQKDKIKDALLEVQLLEPE
jgi:hypothetical protein